MLMASTAGVFACLLQYAAAMAAHRAETRPQGIRHWASNLMLDVADSQMLTSIQPRLQPLITVLEKTPELAWGVLLSPLLLLLLGLLSSGSRKAARVSTVSQHGTCFTDGVEPDCINIRTAAW